jgi:hypothetical protein
MTPNKASSNVDHNVPTIGFISHYDTSPRNHVELALEHDIDLLWIGARSTSRPFNS